MSLTERTHIFKKSDGSWIFSGTVVPSNLRTDDYVEGKFSEGEKFDSEYEYTCVDGVVTKGAKLSTDPPS
tara:strand:+ start:762 stop:971 length:210 start_codon:yes stop_codon:yes gene_type:complete